MIHRKNDRVDLQINMHTVCSSCMRAKSLQHSSSYLNFERTKITTFMCNKFVYKFEIKVVIILFFNKKLKFVIRK